MNGQIRTSHECYGSSEGRTHLHGHSQGRFPSGTFREQEVCTGTGWRQKDLRSGIIKARWKQSIRYQRDQSRGSLERQEMAWKEGLGTASHKGRGTVLMAFGDNDSNLDGWCRHRLYHLRALEWSFRAKL